MSRSTRKLSALAGILAAVAGMISLTGCAESQDVRLNPVWSATLPGEEVAWTKTVNVFPFYSENTTAFADRYEETGNILLFISWSKTMPKTVLPVAGAVVVTPGSSESNGAQVAVPGLATATAEAPKVESSASAAR